MNQNMHVQDYWWEQFLEKDFGWEIALEKFISEVENERAGPLPFDA